MPFEAVIGLEIHAQLQTVSKIFCGCSTAFGAPPNTHVCPVCLGFPGALPVLNRAAVDYGIRAALALGCRINERSIFARKNYFYPDLPKGYQISQYEQPLASAGPSNTGCDWRPACRHHARASRGGRWQVDSRGLFRFRPQDLCRLQPQRHPAHRDRDRARSAVGGGRRRFFSRLRAILVWLGVNDGNMEEGSLRCDANVSVRPAGATTLGTKAEVKNLNSFRFLQKALEYEIDRQTDLSRGRGSFRKRVCGTPHPA